MFANSKTEKSRGTTGVILLAGLANTLSLCRSFGRAGIPVTICATRRCPAHYSRYRTHSLLPLQSESDVEFLKRVLLENPREELLGSVLMACNDIAIEFVALNEERLKNKYILESNPGQIRLALLDKKQSISIAEKAGLQVPQIDEVKNIGEVHDSIDNWKLPVLVRPLISHEFTAIFGRKLILCHKKDEIIDACEKAFHAGVSVTLCEYVPGPDDLLCSYYTYMDEYGKPLFAFTKRVIRRHPYNFGEGSYHVTQWLPDVAAAGQKFFDQAGLRGLGNIEFKRDPRDGQIKFIECNARFTAAQEILVQSNFDIGLFVYGELTGRKFSLPRRFEEGIRMSIAYRDLKAYRYLSSRGKLKFGRWLADTITAKARPYFQWSDPMPFISRLAKRWI